MKRTILFLLAAITIISCQNKQNAEITYTPEFLNSFIKDKNALIAQQHLMNSESERLDILVLDLLQSGPKYFPLTMELLNMKRNRQAVQEAAFQSMQKVHAISDEINLRKKDQATLEKEWPEIRKTVSDAVSSLQTMNADSEKRFREFNANMSGQPSQPSGPRMPTPQGPTNPRP